MSILFFSTLFFDAVANYARMYKGVWSGPSLTYIFLLIILHTEIMTPLSENIFKF